MNQQNQTRAALDSLRPLYRCVLLLHRSFGMSYEDIAKRLELDTEIVKAALASALNDFVSALRTAEQQYNAENLVRDMDILREMLGADDSDPCQWGHRNIFISADQSENLPSLERLQGYGFVEQFSPHHWTATERGCRAIGLDAAQTRRARPLR
jgi:sigma-70-like protein